MSRNFARQKARAGSRVNIKQRGDSTNQNKVVLRVPRGVRVRVKRV